MKDIIENFDRAAEQYEGHAKPQAALAAALAGWISPGERTGRALELGAGTGFFTRLMQPWDGSYLATDAAPKMVAIGRQHCPTATWKIMDSRVLDGLSLMNWIFASSLLQWLPAPSKTLKNWRRFLTADGHLALAILLPGTLGELQTVLPEVKPLDWHSVEDWQTMVLHAGFDIERENVWEQQSHYPNSLELLRTVHAMGLAPKQAVGPGRLRTALYEYDQKYSGSEGVQATWRAWLVRAKVRTGVAARP